jgi:Ca-activated chloride channel family protein
MMKQICTAFLLAFVAWSVVAQESALPMVAIPVIASDSHHRLTSLTVESLLITDQKVPVTGASLMRGADLPVELGLLIDASNSEDSAELNNILKAAKQFLGNSIRGPEDRAFVLDFDATSRATKWLTRDQLQTTSVKVRLGGATALYDALALACEERMGTRDWQKPTRRVLVLISDGDDNVSHITPDEAATEALKTGAVIFTINTEPAPDPHVGASRMVDRGARFMQALAEVTGGQSFDQVGIKGPPKVFATIKEMIDGMYYLRYVPPDASKSALHEVEVKLGPKDKFKLSYARKYISGISETRPSDR